MKAITNAGDPTFQVTIQASAEETKHLVSALYAARGACNLDTSACIQARREFDALLEALRPVLEGHR